MAKWIDPITDRTADDVTQRLPKAFFNVADWIRVYGNTQQVQAVVNVLLALAIPVTELEPPTITGMPRVEEINAFVANIERLRAASCLPVSAGVVALKTDYRAGNSADAPDYRAVNAWERDLELIRDLLARAVEVWPACGVGRCGQAHMQQVGWRRWKGYAPDANDARRVIRVGAVAGASLTRQNGWRSLVNHRKRVTRCGQSVAGASPMRQNGFRRYA